MPGQTRTLKGFAILSLFFFFFILPLERVAARETALVGFQRVWENAQLTLIEASTLDPQPTASRPGSSFGAGVPSEALQDGIMVTPNGLLRIFWPSDAPRGKGQGTILGWRNSDLDIFVVSILKDIAVSKIDNPECLEADGGKPKRVENAIRVGTLLRGAPHPLGQLLQLCGHSTVQVLGSTNLAPSDDNNDFDWVFAFTDPASPVPSFYSRRSLSVAIQVVIFDRPSPARMQYMSLAPISLALGDKALGSDGFSADLASDEEAQKERIRKAKLIDKIGLHTVVRHSPTQKEMLLPVILNQINCSAEIAQLMSKNAPLLATREKRSLSVGQRVVESASTLWGMVFTLIWHFLTVWLYPSITRCFIAGLVSHRIVAEIILRILEWRFRPQSMALKDISATAQQVDIRLQQFCYWPIQYLTLRKRRDEWDSITDRHPDYIRFYNSLWLVANDVIIGIAIGSYIIDNAEWVAFQINTILSEWTVEGLRNMIVWLTDAPAGLKLNNELAGFLGALFMWVIDYWKGWSFASCWNRPLISCRMRGKPPAVPASCHLLYWILQFRRSEHAHFSLLRPPLGVDRAHLLLLHSIGEDLSLAANHHRVPVSSVSRQETQCLAKPDRFVRLRSRPAAPGHYPLHPVILPTPNSHRLLPDLHLRQDGYNLLEGSAGHAAGMFEPFSSFCIDVADQGFPAFTG